jgi:hypothetical protein
MHRRQFLVMLGIAPAALAAAKYLPALAQPVVPVTQTIAFTASHKFEPGDVITITGTKWEGTYKMNLDGVFELLPKASPNLATK